MYIYIYRPTDFVRRCSKEASASVFECVDHLARAVPSSNVGYTYLKRREVPTTETILCTI